LISSKLEISMDIMFHALPTKRSWKQPCFSDHKSKVLRSWLCFNLLTEFSTSVSTTKTLASTLTRPRTRWSNLWCNEDPGRKSTMLTSMKQLVTS
jgi:hypothetical protein